jgi:type I restriction enzyme R subunit
MTPEAKARQRIDQKLEQAGWAIQDMKQLNLAAGENITVTKIQTLRYANADLKWRKDNTPLRFLFEATGTDVKRLIEPYRRAT